MRGWLGDRSEVQQEGNEAFAAQVPLDDFGSFFVGFCAGRAVLFPFLLATRKKHFVQKVGKCGYQKACVRGHWKTFFLWKIVHDNLNRSVHGLISHDLQCFWQLSTCQTSSVIRGQISSCSISRKLCRICDILTIVRNTLWIVRLFERSGLFTQHSVNKLFFLLTKENPW